MSIGITRAAGAGGVVLAAALAAWLLIVPGSPTASGGASSSPTSSRGALRFEGSVPWRDAVRTAVDSRTLTIGGDGDQVGGVGACRETDAQRAEVHETATSIEILVRGYRRAGEPCSQVGHPLTLLTVRLAEPVGARTLVDRADGTAHAVLTDSGVATATRLPMGFADRGARWDDRFPGVTRDFASGGDAAPAEEHVLLEIAPVGSLDRLDHPYWTAAPSTTVHGRVADVWVHSDVYNVNTLVEWRIGRLAYRVTSFGSPKQHLPEPQVLTAARSVQVQTSPLPTLSR